MKKATRSPIQLAHLAMDSVHFERSDLPPSTEEKSYSYDIQLNVEVAQVEIDEHDDSKRLVTASIAVEWEEDPGPFALQVRYRALVVQDGTVEQETFEKVCRLQIPTTILGFVRPLVARLMSEAGESFRLPLIDLRNQDVPHEEDEES